MEPQMDVHTSLIHACIVKLPGKTITCTNIMLDEKRRSGFDFSGILIIRLYPINEKNKAFIQYLKDVEKSGERMLLTNVAAKRMFGERIGNLIRSEDRPTEHPLTDGRTDVSDVDDAYDLCGEDIIDTNDHAEEENDFLLVCSILTFFCFWCPCVLVGVCGSSLIYFLIPSATLRIILLIVFGSISSMSIFLLCSFYWFVMVATLDGKRILKDLDSLCKCFSCYCFLTFCNVYCVIAFCLVILISGEVAIVGLKVTLLILVFVICFCYSIPSILTFCGSSLVKKIIHLFDEKTPEVDVDLSDDSHNDGHNDDEGLGYHGSDPVDDDDVDNITNVHDDVYVGQFFQFLFSGKDDGNIDDDDKGSSGSEEDSGSVDIIEVQEKKPELKKEAKNDEDIVMKKKRTEPVTSRLATQFRDTFFNKPILGNLSHSLFDTPVSSNDQRAEDRKVLQIDWNRVNDLQGLSTSRKEDYDVAISILTKLLGNSSSKNFFERFVIFFDDTNNYRILWSNDRSLENILDGVKVNQWHYNVYRKIEGLDRNYFFYCKKIAKDESTNNLLLQDCYEEIGNGTVKVWVFVKAEVKEGRSRKITDYNKLYYVRGVTYFDMKKYKDSFRDIDRVTLSTCYDNNMLILKGRIMCYLGEYDESIKHFNECIKNFVDDNNSNKRICIDAFQRKCNSLWKMGRFEDAEKCMERCLSVCCGGDSDPGTLYWDLSVLRFQNRKVLLSIEALEKYLKMALPERDDQQLRVRVYCTLGIMYASYVRNYKKAIINFDEAIRYYENLREKRDVSDEVGKCSPPMIIIADLVDTYTNKGVCLYEMEAIYKDERKRYDEEARRACETALKLKPNDVGAMCCLGVVLARMGLFNESGELIREARRMYPLEKLPKLAVLEYQLMCGIDNDHFRQLVVGEGKIEEDVEMEECEGEGESDEEVINLDEVVVEDGTTNVHDRHQEQDEVVEVEEEEKSSIPIEEKIEEDFHN